jgi:hypothetical protein
LDLVFERNLAIWSLPAALPWIVGAALPSVFAENPAKPFFDRF